VRVFSSVARGEARPDSDVDILVDLEPGRSLFDLGGLLYDLQTLLGVDVDVVTEKGLRPRIRAQVMRVAVPVWGATENACWTSWKPSRSLSKLRNPATPV